jgi:glutathione S-transferase
MTADLTLYTNPQSRGRIARWMLEEVGEPYEVEALGYAGAMKAAEYLAINPMGKVPALVHRGRVVTECAAICAYLADAFPDAGLAPPLDDRADYYRWLFFAAGPLEQAAIDRARKIEVSDEQSRMVGYGAFDRVIDTLDAMLTGRRFIAADRFTAADVYVGSHLLWGSMFGWLPKRPSFDAYMAHLSERPAYLRASERDDALAAAA